VIGLRWAGRCEVPKGLGGVSRLRGARARGIAYEKAVAAALPLAWHGQWWEFEDRRGLGFCQTDLVIVGREAALVLEVKYTWTPDAWVQLECLYKPVLELALRRPVFGAQCCRVLRPENDGVVVTGVKEALLAARTGGRVTLHWAFPGAQGVL
jgi:hypothetical protein